MLEEWLNTIQHTDLLTLCGALPSQSIDMILCDLPYGTTACAWDSIIPLEPMWEQFKRVIKPRGAIVLTASQPFTSKLVMSNPEMFRCEWIWEKPKGSGYLNANRLPLKAHEACLVFAFGLHDYYPQMKSGKPYRATRGAAGGYVQDKTVAGYLTVNNGDRYPTTVIDFDIETGLHPTQKPVALFEYLIRTYTQAGELILDPCIGSGTTAIAARQTGRQFIGGDLTLEYVEIARKRLAMPYTPPLFLDEVAVNE